MFLPKKKKKTCEKILISQHGEWKAGYKKKCVVLLCKGDKDQTTTTKSRTGKSVVRV
jgi:hypothetical protein